MSAERPELRLVRESLEAVLAPTAVSSVLFEALETLGGKPPADADGFRLFVDVPLRGALGRRLGADVDSIVDGVLATLDAMTTAPPPRAGRRAPSRRELDVTREVFLDDRPVTVAVVSSSDEFAVRLQAALGGARVKAVPVPTLTKLGEVTYVATPAIVLVDAADFAAIEPEQLAGALEKLPETTVRAIWGADLPFGASVLRELVARSSPATPFDRREGIEPLLDLVRSRRGGE